MDSLDQKLAEARDKFSALRSSVNHGWGTPWAILSSGHYGAVQGFDAAAAIAREVVAEKDAEIARLETQLAASFKANGELALENEARRIRLRGLGLDTEMATT